jgi:hypothetical protein
MFVIACPIVVPFLSVAHLAAHNAAIRGLWLKWIVSVLRNAVGNVVPRGLGRYENVGRGVDARVVVEGSGDQPGGVRQGVMKEEKGSPTGVAKGTLDWWRGAIADEMIVACEESEAAGTNADECGESSTMSFSAHGTVAVA